MPASQPPKATKASKAAQLKLWIAEQASPSGEPPYVGPAQWDVLRSRLAPVSDSYLRRLLRESGAVLDPLVEGVRQDDFDTLARSLTALAEVYERGLHRETRKLVIQAKDHARLASRRAADETKRRTKDEMVEWMITWLENPVIFSQWAALRLRAMNPQDAEGADADDETAGS